MAETLDDLSQPLRDACNLVLAQKDLRPDGDKTFCNIGTQRICRLMGYEKLINLTANEIFDHLTNSEEWAPVDPDVADKCAKFGGLVIAAQKGDPHGHCAVVYPDILLYSGKWRAYCPKVANIGPEKYFGIVGANYAFAQPPIYFWRREMTSA